MEGRQIVVTATNKDYEKSKEANAFVRRQDGWALVSKGVPALMVGGAFSDMQRLQSFLADDYHGPEDELTNKTELGGAAEDADLHIALARYFANQRKFPRQRADRKESSAAK
jgi:hypothetical protein